MWAETQAMLRSDSPASTSPSSTRLKLNVSRKFSPLWGRARYKGAHGGRGSGKSHGFAEMLIAKCVAKPGTRAACVREVQKSLKNSVKLLVEDKIRSMGVASLFEILEAEIKTPGGGVIIFQGMQNHTADSIKSLEGFDICWVEEAQSLSQRSLGLLRPTLRAQGSELWFSWNPNKPDDPVDRLLRGENPPRDAVIVEVNHADNPWFPPELRSDMEDDRQRDPDEALHVWDGEYANRSSARVFKKNWKVEAFETPPGVIHRFGADWGFAQDPTALVRCYVEGRKLYVDAEAVEVGCEIDETPYLFSGDVKPQTWPAKTPFSNGPYSDAPNRKKREGIAGAAKSLIRADNARPETVSYMKRHGYRITAAIKGAGSLEDGVAFLKSFDIIVHPDCKHVAQELRDYSYKIDPHTEEVLSDLEDKNNHTIDALRYALEELRRTGYKPSEDRRPDRPNDRYRPRREEDSWKTA
jgi:phage terminase large subunit